MGLGWGFGLGLSLGRDWDWSHIGQPKTNFKYLRGANSSKILYCPNLKFPFSLRDTRSTVNLKFSFSCKLKTINIIPSTGY